MLRDAASPRTAGTSSTHPRRAWPRPTLQGAVLLLLSLFFLGVAWLRSMNLLMLLSYQMLFFWVLNLVLAGRRLERLTVQRRLGGPVFADVPFRQEIEISNLDRRQQLGLELLDRGPAHSQRAFTLQLGAGASCAVAAELVLRQRGRYRGARFQVESGYPFGLVKRRVLFADRLEVVVLPSVGQVHRGKLRRFLQHAALADGRLRAQARPQPLLATEFHGLRPFHSGDSLSWIHWRTSARRGELMVREFEEAAGDNLTVVLDPWLPEAGRDPHAALLEEAVSLAATICWEWCRQTDDRLTFILADSAPILLNGVTGPEHALRVLECLALASGTSRPGWDELLDQLPRVRLPGGPVLLVTTRSSDLGERLARVLRRPVACIEAANIDRHDFYERPARHAP